MTTFELKITPFHFQTSTLKLWTRKNTSCRDLENGGGGDMKAEARSGHGKLHNWAPDRVCWWKGSLIRRIIIWCTCHPSGNLLVVVSATQPFFFYLSHLKETWTAWKKPRLVSKLKAYTWAHSGILQLLKTGMTARLSYWNFQLHAWGVQKDLSRIIF